MDMNAWRISAPWSLGAGEARIIRLAVVVLVAPGAEHGEGAEADREDEGQGLAAPSALEYVDPEGDDDQDRAAVERDLCAGRPGRDLAAALAPEQIDEKRDGQEERDPCQRHERQQRRLLVQQDHHDDDPDDDQEAAQRRVHVGEEASHPEVKYALVASAPPTSVAPVNHASRRRGSSGAYSQGASTTSSARVP